MKANQTWSRSQVNPYISHHPNVAEDFLPTSFFFARTSFTASSDPRPVCLREKIFTSLSLLSLSLVWKGCARMSSESCNFPIQVWMFILQEVVQKVCCGAFSHVKIWIYVLRNWKKINFEDFSLLDYWYSLSLHWYAANKCWEISNLMFTMCAKKNFM